MPAIKKAQSSRDRVAAYRARRRQQGLKPVQIWVPDGSSPNATASPLSPADDPALTRYRATLDEMYGDRIERIVLYGSRARGDAHPESDYDIAVFLHGMSDRWRELDRLADLSTSIIEKDGPFIHAMVFPAGSYDDPTALMYAIRADAIDL